MFRFFMPNPDMPLDERVEHLRSQGRAFLRNDALRDLFSLLDVDQYTIARTFDGRRTPDGRIQETQELGTSARLEACRDELYPLIRELGFLDINEPIRREQSRVVVLGGSLDACEQRTLGAKRWISPSTRFVDGLACFRPISPRERLQSESSFRCDTEFGALAECFSSTFDLDLDAALDDFNGDRNLNAISSIKAFDDGRRAFSCRIFAAPSTQPTLRRADTGDALSFYLQHADPDAGETLLAVTDNRHCNRQFLQIAYQLVRAKRPLGLDIVGCTPDERIVTQERYDPFQFVQDLIGILDWIGRIENELPR